MIDGRTEIYGVIGHPIAHTSSPALHNAAFGAEGMNASYAAFDVAPESLGEAISGMRALNIRGLNVTVPHKEKIIRYLDGVVGEAALLRSVNVVDNKGGRLTGYNTDVEGFKRSLEHAGVNVAGEKIVVLGAGGAARSVVRALELGGAGEIAVVNRTHEKAESLAAESAARGGRTKAVSFSSQDGYNILRDCAIIVNATSVGLRPGDGAPLDTEMLNGGHTLVDLIYKPPLSEFLAAGAARGARTLNGFGMLVFQAMEAFRIWTGRTPRMDVMWDAGTEG
ncbi:MAG TPA: shikimate dehydrogenase [bacterium]|nr:shikimate dehydrogenase [bacterium]